MTWVTVILAAAGLPVLAACLYLFALTLVALAAPRRSRPAFRTRRRFVVVVPAHNEEIGLGRTLTELSRLHWRADHLRVVVVADNCTDDTARVARQHGAEVMERHDTARRGKGYALDFAFRQLLTEPSNAWHAAVVVDADTVVSPNLLDACSARFDAGARAVQATYLAFPRRGALSAITQTALTAIHVVRSTARERLGLSVGLKGNGMAFTRALLATMPHRAYTRTEDLEFGVQLALAGVRVAYAGDTTVWGDMPVTDAVAARQRERWIGGRMEVAHHYLRRLVRSAVRHRSLMRADVALDLLIPPVSVLAIATVCGVALSAALASRGAWTAFGIWAAAFAALGVHVLDAARRAGHAWDLLGFAGALPAYALGKLRITLRAPARFGEAWVRTARAGEAA
jgi:1,2-diacylglycerol 3-beta-glucosyltransferase